MKKLISIVYPRPMVSSIRLLMCLATLIAMPAMAAKELANVIVDCAAGDSINTVLDKNKSNILEITVIGLCNESVVINQDDVTLRGELRRQDGLRGNLIDTLLTIDNAKNVVIENLSLEGGADGLLISRSRTGIAVANVSIDDNTGNGAVIIDSTVAMSEMRIGDNGIFDDKEGVFGLLVSEHSSLQCDDCAVGSTFGLDTAVGAIDGSTILFRGSTIDAVNLALKAHQNSTISIGSSSIGPQLDYVYNAFISSGSVLGLFDSTFTGSIGVNDDSSLSIVASQHVTGGPGTPKSNIALTGRSWISVASNQGVATELADTTLSLNHFSRGRIIANSFNPAPIMGTMGCLESADLIIDSGIAGNPHTFNPCPSDRR